jgi:hypothetical protein
MHDPFQIHPALGAYSGLATSFQSPYSSLNPVAAFNPLAAAYQPMAGIIPQLQLAQILATRAAIPQLSAASPWSNGLNNPLLALLQNPLIAASLENPLVNQLIAQTQFGAQQHNPFNPYIGQQVPQFGQQVPQFGQQVPQFGQQVPQFGQQVPPYWQIGSPYGQISPMLAPQSWVGQQGLYGNSPLGQVHPLVSQLLSRGLQAGMFPQGF